MNVSVGEVISNGVLFDVKNWRDEKFIHGSIIHDVEELFEKLNERQLNFVLVGGIALLSYFEGRNTQDLDLILSRKEVALMPEILVIDEVHDFISGKFGTLKVDILLTRNKLFDLVRKKYSSARLFGKYYIPCATVVGLLILKLYALPSLYRLGKMEKIAIYESDVTILLSKYSIDLEEIFSILKTHLSSTDIAALREIMVDIHQRIKRMHGTSLFNS